MAKKLRLTEDEKSQIWDMVHERVYIDSNLTDWEKQNSFCLVNGLQYYYIIEDILEDEKRKSKDVI